MVLGVSFLALPIRCVWQTKQPRFEVATYGSLKAGEGGVLAIHALSHNDSSWLCC